jgi:hypothetical protein
VTIPVLPASTSIIATGLPEGVYTVTWTETLRHPVNDGSLTCRFEGEPVVPPPSLARGSFDAVSTLVVAAVDPWYPHRDNRTSGTGVGRSCRRSSSHHGRRDSQAARVGRSCLWPCDASCGGVGCAQRDGRRRVPDTGRWPWMYR